MRSLGLLPGANSIGVLSLSVTCVFRTVTALRISWTDVIYDREVLSKFQEIVSIFNQRTSTQLDLAKEYVVQ